jgi:peptidyl-Lys metalloendopeptidase
MLSSSLRASLVALVAFAFAFAVSAAPSLTVKSWTPNFNVDGVENLDVTTTITNTGGERIKLLNDPRGVLDPFHEDSFYITNATGAHPLFKGATVDHMSVYLTNVCAHAFGFRF